MTKRCPECKRTFNTPARKQVRCSYACARKHQGRLMRGKCAHFIAHANTVRLARQRERYRQELQRTFGELSVRELELIRRAIKLGWAKGYYAATRKQSREQAA